MSKPVLSIPEAVYRIIYGNIEEKTNILSVSKYIPPYMLLKYMNSSDMTLPFITVTSNMYEFDKNFGYADVNIYLYIQVEESCLDYYCDEENNPVNFNLEYFLTPYRRAFLELAYWIFGKHKLETGFAIIPNVDLSGSVIMNLDINPTYKTETGKILSLPDNTVVLSMSFNIKAPVENICCPIFEPEEC